MSLAKLEVCNVRNIKAASLQPSPNINLIIGDNASGKSSLLEAIFLLSRARSFRSSHIKQVINFESDHLTVAGRCTQGTGQVVNIGVKLDARRKEIKLAGRKLYSSSELAYAFPVQIIHPASYMLLEGEPRHRRGFLDWGMFHVEHSFLQSWKKYKRALDQRNAMLRGQSELTFNVWDRELAQYGQIINHQRETYIHLLQSVLAPVAKRFLDFASIELLYSAGWDMDKNLAVALKDDLQKDRKYGYTHSGPHRGDFALKVDNHPAKQFASRGQIKLLVLALNLAQASLMKKFNSNPVCILIDDLASELDPTKQRLLANFLMDLDAQLFITATDRQKLADFKHSEMQVFHVKHGSIARDG